MKLLRGLSWRILLASLLCGLVGLAASLLIVAPRGMETAREVIGPVLLTLAQRERPRCEADPGRWSLAIDGGARGFAYDEVTLRSENRDAPPLDPRILSGLPRGDDLPIVFLAQRLSGKGALVMRMAEGGPCALVHATWPRRRMRLTVTYALLGGVVAILAAAVGLSLLGVVRPLARRILRLRRAADGIGAEADLARDDDAHDDELAELGDRIAAAHDRIRRDAETLREREHQLRRFVADVSHDLRTPLSSLQLALEQASDACAEPDVAAQLARAIEDTVYIAALTTNLRMASLLREGWDPVPASPRVDLTPTVERVVARSRIFARRRGVTLEVGTPDEPVLVACNPIAAEQAITNVVENAVAYGDTGGRVAVVLDLLGDGRFRVTVLDDGPGVPPQELPRLGERAFRSDAARQRDPRGSGLGLAITSEVAARCGWTLEFAAAPPRGLRVEITGGRLPAG